MLCVEEVHDDVEDLEKSSNDVDRDDCHIPFQNPIRQPTYVTVETGGKLDVQTIKPTTLLNDLHD